MKRIKKILASLMVTVMVLTAAPLSGFAGIELNLDWLDLSTEVSAVSKPTFSINLKSETYTQAVIEIILEDGGFTAVDFILKYDSTKFSGCSSAQACMAIALMSAEGEAASQDIEASTGIYSAAVANGFDTEGTVIATYTLEKIKAPKISLKDITLTVSACADTDGVKDGAVVINNIPVLAPPISGGACGDNLEWVLESDGNLLIYGTGKMTNYSSTSFSPWYEYSDIIKSIAICDGVTGIGSSAFVGCKNLASVSIPDSVATIGNTAFRDCTSLDSIAVPNTVSTIEYYTFYGCTALTKVQIPDGVTTIRNYAFSQCAGLETVIIPASVTNIVKNAFYQCPSLKMAMFMGTREQWSAVTVGERNEAVTDNLIFVLLSGTCGADLFWYVTDDYELNITGTGDMYDYSSASDVPWYSLQPLIETVTIGNDVASIGDYVFNNCTSITSIRIPGSVARIGNRALSGCEKLEEVIFTGNGAVAIGEEVFYGSPKAMICCEEHSYMHTYAGANNLKYCLTDKNGVPSYEIKNDILLSYRGESTDVSLSTVTKIGYGAFENNSVIETVVLSSSVYLISANAFRNCSSLETVIIPESVTSIAADAFDGCDNLTIWCYAGSYADGYAAENGINVKYIALDIERDILVVMIKGTFSLTASLNTPFAKNTGVVWSSTNTSIATVDGNGVVKGVKAGTAVIVATSKEGGLRDYCVVKVVGIEALSTAAIDHENGTIMGLSSNLDSLDGYVELSDPSCNLSYDSLGTDSIVYVECDGEIVDAYTVIIFGDVNGDSWYDGQDAVLVSCLANGMLTKDNVSEAVYTAADCNHDGVIDEADVALLNEAGMLLTNVDQTKPSEVLLETSAEYFEYISLIDQSPKVDIEPDDITSEQHTKIELFEMIIKFIKSIFEMLFSLQL